MVSRAEEQKRVFNDPLFTKKDSKRDVIRRFIDSRECIQRVMSRGSRDCSVTES